MATFRVDPTNSLLVISQDGRVVPRDMLDPSDVVQAAPAPAAPAPAAPVPAPTRTPVVEAVLAKRDKVLGPLDAAMSARAVPGALPIVQQTTSTQRGLSAAQLSPILAANTASAERQASGIEAAGATKTQRQEQGAMAETGQAFGRQTMAIQDRDQARQRAEIARQNELALSLQKDPELDPDRFVRNLGTGGAIAAVILAALSGGFAAASGRGGNDALDVLQKRIDADLMAQKEQIASGRIRRGNLIAYFQNAGLRDEAAAKAAEATIWAMADRMAAAEQSRIAAPEHREQAQLLADQLRAQTAAKNQELQLTLGTDRSTTTTLRARPDPGGGGSALEQVKLAGAMLELDNARLDRMGADEVSAAVGRQLSPAAAEKLKATVASVGPGIAETDGAVNFTAQYVNALGGSIDTATGHITWPEDGDLKGAGPLDSRPSLKAGPAAPIAKLASATGLVHTDYQKAKDAQDALREFITKSLTGASATPDQQRTFANMVGADLDNEDRVRANVENWANTLWSMRAGQKARLGADGQKLLEANRAAATPGPPASWRRGP